MKAIILNSGVGERLRPLTDNKPKALIKIGDKTLLDYQMDSLLGCDIKDIIITTGHFGNKIRGYVMKKYPDINVSFVDNPRYVTTNYIYSLWLTKGLIDDDVILLHGDLLFDGKLLPEMISQKSNCVLVNRDMKLPEKDFKAVVEHNRVVKIGREFFGKNAFFCAPLYKFSKADFSYWLGVIEKCIKRGDTKSYAEDAFNKISGKIALQPLYFDDEVCVEIDTTEDLEIARNLVKSRSTALA